MVQATFDASVVSKNLKSLREEKGMSKMEFAKFLGYPYRNYCYYESGDQVPRLKKLIEICNNLDITLSSLVGR